MGVELTDLLLLQEWRGPESPAESLVTVEPGKRKIDFLIDIQPTYLVLNTNQEKLSWETVNVVGPTGKVEKWTFFNAITFKFRKQWITYRFLYVPECLVPLLGRDLLSKLEAQTTFEERNTIIGTWNSSHQGKDFYVPGNTRNRQLWRNTQKQ